MKILRNILFPVVPIYYLITRLRNWLYDKGFKSSKSYDIPIICVGNLSTGGTGKTPMIEYLIRLLKDKKNVATLSRGYKRITEGFVLADKNATADTIGDEPFQFFRKFKGIKVAVDGDRQNAIAKLLALTDKPELILLDDAYQHRKVNAGFNILLTAYYKLYSDDMVLPTGNLREPRSGAKRADIIVVTKCPSTITDSEKNTIIDKLKIRKHQRVFFSTIQYSDKVISTTGELILKQLPKFTLVTGIANANPLLEFLNENSLAFNHIEYPDHYSFKPEDVEMLSHNDLIVTTEKDFVRLSEYEIIASKLYYLPIELAIDKRDDFDKMITNFMGI
ncbi:tetraacyldisaccharide 4'-kinase [uncultured Winogradskyella sp.]|uniref:tetraacyldisaccharide 4'-kinase n=1 Tax=uncultured Winogradskyella sp. TaxID=395353 RepID=UPI00263095C8|nr:tetraacyldisaccharide 4'-kinase [uncultured Winogradskyella sp.]